MGQTGWFMGGAIPEWFVDRKIYELWSGVYPARSNRGSMNHFIALRRKLFHLFC
jgi:hypothetical protein